jgi:hypothetical protein
MLSNAIRGHMAELGIISAKGRNGTAELLQIIGDVADDRIPSVARFSASTDEILHFLRSSRMPATFSTVSTQSGHALLKFAVMHNG